ncbi:MAG TPA: prepilin-type N-terminal cleavage/methylation domain-containing protein [Candidatus Dormibacteraeota bacterium]|nr:prepilin-type N-terminal cleavage/methylation domain-containing protein [Candidatus Dormibacteraeota bacterium]
MRRRRRTRARIAPSRLPLPAHEGPPRSPQAGFTLIELLVVISILGILAAIVTMSMVGITTIAQQRAAAAEEQTVQVAFDTMLAEQQVDIGNICQGLPADAPARVGTRDMSQFPVSTPYTGPASHHPVALWPRYLRQQTTHGVYRCVVTVAPNGTVEDTGQVQQVSYSS